MAELTHEDLEELLMIGGKVTDPKPCPFCGGKVYCVYTSKSNSYYFFHYRERERCAIEEFRMMGDRYKSLAEAVRAWNRRTE